MVLWKTGHCIKPQHTKRNSKNWFAVFVRGHRQLSGVQPVVRVTLCRHTILVSTPAVQRRVSTFREIPNHLKRTCVVSNKTAESVKNITRNLSGHKWQIILYDSWIRLMMYSLRLQQSKIPLSRMALPIMISLSDLSIVHQNFVDFTRCQRICSEKCYVWI